MDRFFHSQTYLIEYVDLLKHDNKHGSYKNKSNIKCPVMYNTHCVVALSANLICTHLIVQCTIQ